MLKDKLGKGIVFGFTGMFAAAFAAINLAGIITLIVFMFSPWAFAEDSIAKNQQANAQCFTCHAKKDLSATVNGAKVSLYVDPAQFGKSIHGTNACTSCHNDLGGVPHTKLVYDKELIQQVNNQCGRCHDAAGKSYSQSIHGQQTTVGNNAATCMDCHGSHEILKTDNPSASVYRLNVPATCGKCHQGKVKEAYDYSFHGTSVSLGYEKGATCVDCHGSHSILGPNDPKSSVNKQNVPETCAQCHLQAQPNFAKGNEHVVPQDRENAFPLWVIWKIFICLILFDVLKDGSIAIFELIRKIRSTKQR
jgi:hypothetical protein